MRSTLYAILCLLIHLAATKGAQVTNPQSSVVYTNSSKTTAVAQKGNSTTASARSISDAVESINKLINRGVEGKRPPKSFAEQSVKLFCNVSGPCRPCSPVPEGGIPSAKSDISETHKCRHFSHVQQLECEVDWATAEHSVDVKVDPLPEQGYTSRQRHNRVVHHQGCVVSGGTRSVFWFEFGMLAVLCVSLPIVIWRKHIAQAGR